MSIPRLSRRKFLQSAAMAATAVPAAGLGIDLGAIQAATDPVWPSVSVAQGSNDDTPEAMLKTALDGLGGIARFIKPGQVVVIKPNATWAFRPHTSSATDPDLLKALIQIVKDAGAKRILVVDHCSIDPGTAEALRINGIGKVVDEMGVEKLFPDRFNAHPSVYTKIDIPDGKAFKKIGVIKAAIEADVRINLALAKSHNVTKMTMCLKHMMGLLEVPQNLHTNVEQGISDINLPSPMQAQLHILEAIRVRWPYPNGQRVCAGPETDLTYPNVIKRMNMVVAGSDPVLIDAYGCVQFFNSKPEELTHVLRAHEAGVGELDVAQASEAGRLKIYKVGQPVLPPSTPAPVSTRPASTAAPEQTSAPTAIPGTPTPMPTATPLPADLAKAPSSAVPASAAVGGCSPADQNVVNPNRFLSGALIPAAMIILGAGIVVGRRFNQGEKEEDAHESGE